MVPVGSPPRLERRSEPRSKPPMIRHSHMARPGRGCDRASDAQVSFLAWRAAPGASLVATAVLPVERSVMRRRLASVVVLSVLLAAGATLAYRAAYGTWWGTPDHISYCGRTYLRGTAGLTRAEIVGFGAALPGDAPYPVVTVATVPPVVGQPLVAALTPQAERQRLGVPCTMVVYLKTGTDAYTGYGLSGGP